MRNYPRAATCELVPTQKAPAGHDGAQEGKKPGDGSKNRHDGGAPDGRRCGVDTENDASPKPEVGFLKPLDLARIPSPGSELRTRTAALSVAGLTPPPAKLSVSTT